MQQQRLTEKKERQLQELMARDRPASASPTPELSDREQQRARTKALAQKGESLSS
jgi:hypothetical protein